MKQTSEDKPVIMMIRTISINKVVCRTMPTSNNRACTRSYLLVETWWKKLIHS
jgi:hypothetical protein